MIHENQEYRYHTNNTLNLLVGILVGGLAGAVTMLLLAPQTGKDTRKQIREKSIELRDRTNEIMEDSVAQIGLITKKIAVSGREAIKELAQHGQELAAEQSGHVAEAAQAGKEALKAA
jgi:gas vesicle protein